MKFIWGAAKRLRTYVWLVLWFTGLMIEAQAQGILFSFKGIGTGVLGSKSFSDKAFSIDVMANLADVQFPAGQPTPIFTVTDSSSTITITGLGFASFTTPHRVFCTPEINGGMLGFGVVTSDGRPGADLLDIESSAFSNYHLKRAIGPLTNLKPDGPALSQFRNQATTLGAVSMTGATQITFQAQLVPEPSAALLLSGGICSLVVLRRHIKGIGRA